MISVLTLNYAAFPPDHLWQWAPQHDAIEWHDGKTLALWTELHGILAFLDSQSGIPPLGSILLVMAACHDDWLTTCIDLHGKLMSILQVNKDTMPADIRQTFTEELMVIHNLPKDLRSTFRAKCHLLSALFEGGPHSRPKKESSLILQQLSLLGPAAISASLPDMASKVRILRDLRALKLGLRRHDAVSLENRLRTSLENSDLQPLPLDQPPNPDTDSRPILEHLASAGGESKAAAAVALRTIAMMNFPGNFGTPNELPVGGISDITNRGTLDRLLPGELAADDLVLAARLVHQEALYFKRELPPENIIMGHTILLDRGLRLWGAVRIFSLGIALGLRHHPMLNGVGRTIESWAATEDGFTDLDLATPQGIHASLETLIPSPGAEAFLTSWWQVARALDEEHVSEVSFITAKEHLTAGTCRILGDIAAWLKEKSGQLRIFSLDRFGILEVLVWSPTGNRIIQRGEFDLDEILGGMQASAKSIPAPPLLEKPDPLHALLPIYAKPRLPFLFPLQPKPSAFIPLGDSPESGVIGISDANNLMEWPQPQWGGQEVIAKVPGRNHWMASDDRGTPLLIVSGEAPGSNVRIFYYENGGLSELPITKSLHSFPRNATVSGGAVLLAYSDQVEALSLNSGQRLAVQTIPKWLAKPLITFDGSRIFIHEDDKPHQINPWRAINKPNLMISPQGIGIHDETIWVISRSTSYKFNKTRMSWDQNSHAKVEFVNFETSEKSPAEGVKLSIARFKSGQEIWMDPRGILHIMDLSFSDAVSWSILLSSPAASAWHPSWGLCSMTASLRFPKDHDAGGLAQRSLAGHLSTLKP